MNKYQALIVNNVNAVYIYAESEASARDEIFRISGAQPNWLVLLEINCPGYWPNQNVRAVKYE